MEFDADSYFGSCPVCGWVGEFVRNHRAIRETYNCGGCRASLREQGQADALVRHYALPGVTSLATLVTSTSIARLSVYEPGLSGTLRPYLGRIADYTQSFYYTPEERAAAPVRHEDLQALSFPDCRFDLVVTSDVLEHVRHPLSAFAEIFRVLKPGGLNLFTVPLQEPLRQQTTWRVDTSGPEDVHLLEEQYHGDGRGGRSLVYANFGRDIVDMLAETGFETELVYPRTPSEIANRAITVKAVRPS
tara:strand:- start:42221 stop:42958 length:738 start_codon:yes stop_codon:yes gene_type:complete